MQGKTERHPSLTMFEAVEVALCFGWLGGGREPCSDTS